MKARLFQKIFGQPWLIESSAWQQRVLQCLRAFEDDEEQERTVAMERRPAQDYYGNPIPKWEMRGDVAIIPVKGALVKGAEPWDRYAYGDIDYDDVIEDLAAAQTAGASRAILHLNSPGGTVLGLEETTAILAASALPVFAFTDTWATSAAYALAVATNGFYVTPSAITGSVGTIAQRPDMTKMLEDFGVKVETFTSGKLKSTFSPATEMTEGQRTWMQEWVDESGEAFRSFVRARMGDSIPDDYMQGQILDGRTAMNAGMATATVSNLTEVIQLTGPG
jgi:protease IV